MLEELNAGVYAHMEQLGDDIRKTQGISVCCNRRKKSTICRKRFPEDEGFLISEELFQELEILYTSMIKECICETAAEKILQEPMCRTGAETFCHADGKSVNLPYQVVAERTYGGVRLQKREKQPEHKITEPVEMLSSQSSSQPVGRQSGQPAVVVGFQ